MVIEGTAQMAFVGRMWWGMWRKRQNRVKVEK
jgi:hypothetical protein